MAKKFALIILILALWATTDYGLTEKHEQAHQQIYRQFGCESFITNYGPFMGGVTTSEKGCKDTEAMRTLHSQNEIEGYHARAMHTTLWTIFYMGTIIFLYRKELSDQT